MLVAFWISHLIGFLIFVSKHAFESFSAYVAVVMIRGNRRGLIRIGVLLLCR